MVWGRETRCCSPFERCDKGKDVRTVGSKKARRWLRLASPTQHPYRLTLPPYPLLLPAARHAADAVDVADQRDRHVLLQLMADGARQVHDATLGLDADARSVETAMARQLALGHALDGGVVGRLGDTDEVGDAGVAEVAG